jgi:hypothetical protein
MFEHFLENHTRIQRDFFIFVAFESSENDIWLGGQILDGGETRTNLSTKKEGEYLGDVLSRLEFKPGNMSDEMVEKVGVVRLLSELSDKFGLWVCGKYE